MARTDTPNRIRGTQDIVGEDERRFARVVDAFDHVRRLYCFDRLELPVFEATAVFARSLGETTDVVSKEMYTFDDRGGDSVTLRPEFTAGIARAFITNGWQQHAPMKLATHGPVFRYERPQKGRYRQFHQIDAEIIGAAEPAADVELLTLADQLLNELGIAEGVTLQLNTLGDPHSREGWRLALIEHFANHQLDLSEESRVRLETNPLRILDSKSPQDQQIVAEAPGIDEFLTRFSRDYFEAVTGGLDAAGVAWTRNARLVRGLDYYRHTAFEFVTDRLGAQGTVIAGGRYDGLIESLGGNPTPGVGWAAGIERLAMLLDEPAAKSVDAVVVPLGEAAATRAQGILAQLRRAGLAVDMAFKGNMKKRMAKADALRARYAVILGDDEIASGEAGVKNLATGEQQPVALDALAETLSAA
ncbi:histidine--tRNA ligase [Stakelama saccharophila]|uniref:Histidine--tRNA ligase n=1 Tax=Stakelama saccharophila TaxID=3075605 RepID=A0ABZ0BA52_9SPHN|nr:histidine--tRNA ligase [Stakelama sp. W311]WNO54290.1 histidine--tRNA ligase [Stakelama sp. W311]